MKNVFRVILVLFVVGFMASCARGITPWQAANGKAKCGKNYLR